jgi:hypothetical protein
LRDVQLHLLKGIASLQCLLVSDSPASGLLICCPSFSSAVEIAGGLGPSIGKVWRVGVMGFNARPAAVEQVLVAFRHGLANQGWKKPAAAGKSEL